MLTKTEARQLALDYLKQIESASGVELVLVDFEIEKEFGWVFFYDSRPHYERGIESEALVGNAPIVVTKADGKLHETGTAYPLEHYLKEFERY